MRDVPKNKLMIIYTSKTWQYFFPTGWYHLPCGINNGSLQVNHEVNGKTVCKSYCPNHRPGKYGLRLIMKEYQK